MGRLRETTVGFPPAMLIAAKAKGICVAKVCRRALARELEGSKEVVDVELEEARKQVERLEALSKALDVSEELEHEFSETVKAYLGTGRDKKGNLLTYEQLQRVISGFMSGPLARQTIAAIGREKAERIVHARIMEVSG